MTYGLPFLHNQSILDDIFHLMKTQKSVVNKVNDNDNKTLDDLPITLQNAVLFLDLHDAFPWFYVLCAQDERQ